MKEGLAERAWRDGLDKIAKPAESNHWAAARDSARSLLEGLKSVSSDAPHAAAAKTVQRFAEVAERQVLLDAVSKALDGDFGPASRLPTRESLASFPASLRRALDYVRHCQILYAETAKSDEQPPEPAKIRFAIAELTANEPSVRNPLRHVEIELAVQAFLQGHPAPARDLLKDATCDRREDEGPTDHDTSFADLVRDLKAVVVGEGKLDGDGVGTKVGDEHTGLHPARGPPPGAAKFLLPEAGVLSYRPPLVESPFGKLPPLKRAIDAIAIPLREEARTKAREESAQTRTESQAALKELRQVAAGFPRAPPVPIPGDDEKRKRFAASLTSSLSASDSSGHDAVWYLNRGLDSHKRGDENQALEEFAAALSVRPSAISKSRSTWSPPTERHFRYLVRLGD
ncbi:MAG: hypothetical protein NTY19_24625 [Planctomycetota bacterium]|nr:hypothetical protein [Planctomycetota bacterium]